MVTRLHLIGFVDLYAPHTYTHTHTQLSTCTQTFRLPLLGPPVLNEVLLGHDFVMKAALSRRRASAYFLTQNSV